MNFVGIDIGSTATKVVVMDETKTKIHKGKIMPSGWNSKDTAREVLTWLLEEEGFKREELVIVATGYGRISVPFADRTVTEITCHGKGAYFLGAEDGAVIDIGGQDTKLILLDRGMIADFIMNDKCSAGTGKFLEIMANRLGLSLEEMFDYAQKGREIPISSTCTVFAESEIISLMGEGASREDIAAGVVLSIAQKVETLVNRKARVDNYFLTGGFCHSEYMRKVLSEKLGAEVKTHAMAGYAGAIGAALSG